MLSKTKKLLQDAGRFWELLIGYVSAVISVAFAATLVWLVYIVAWRNPREYGVNDLFKVSTLSIFSLFLIVAIGFSVLAFRLIVQKGRRQWLMSPILLRIWGVFFAAGSICILIDCIVNKRWDEAWRSWNILITSISMAVAAFVLARKQKRTIEKQFQSNQSQPDCEERVTKIQ